MMNKIIFKVIAKIGWRKVYLDAYFREQTLNKFDKRVLHRNGVLSRILAFLGTIASRYGILVNGFIKNFAEIVTN